MNRYYARLATIVRRPTRLAAILVLLLVALTAGIMVTSAVHNEGLLELDGNTAFNGGCGPSGTACGAANPDKITTAATFDWATTGAVKGVCKAGAGGDIAAESPRPALVTASSCEKDYAQPDNTYHAGSDKDIDDSNTWKCGGKPNAQDKTDILNAYAIQTKPSSTRIIDYFASERDTNNGTSFTGFWLFQANTACDASGNFGPGHTAGDVLLLFSFPSGGSTSSVAIFTWLHPAGVSTCAVALFKGTLCPATPITGNPLDCKVVTSADAACGRSNSGLSGDPGAFTPPWKTRAVANQVIDVLDFVEAGVDMNAFFPNGVPCFSSLAAETRSSATPDATLKDFSISRFDTCNPNLSLLKSADAAEVDAGSTIGFTINVTNSGAAGTGTARAVSLSDALPGSTPFGIDWSIASVTGSGGFTPPVSACSITGSPPTETLQCNFGDMGAGKDVDVHVTSPTTYNAATCRTGITLPNTASATATNHAEVRGSASIAVHCPSTKLEKGVDAASDVKITAKYTYRETNNGDVALSSVAVTDDQCSPVTAVDVSPADGFNDGDANKNGKLDPGPNGAGETWVFKCAHTYTMTENPQDFTNTAIGAGTSPLNHVVTFCGITPAAGRICNDDETDSTTIHVEITVGGPEP